jgi:hypothetical protein
VIAVVAAAVWALNELAWAASAGLRSHRRQFRLQLAFFFTLIVAIYAGSVLRLIPDRFHYGDGVLRYASDSVTYQNQAETIAADLRHGSTAGLRDPQKFLYSKLLGSVFAFTGRHALAAMFVNGLFYSATLACVFLIASELFGSRIAARATAISAVWPGFVLHEAQTLRWVETTLGIELFILGILMVLRRGWALGALAIAVVGYAFLLTDQPYLARLISLLTVAFGAALWIYLWSRGDPTRPAAAVATLGVLIVLVFQLMWADSARRADDQVNSERAWGLGVTQASPKGIGRMVVDRFERYLVPVALARRGFQAAELEQADGTLAGPVPPLMSPDELVMNLPTAFATALLAPFPSQVVGSKPGVTNIRKFIWVELIPYYVMLPLAFFAMVMTIVNGTRTPATSQAAFILAVTMAVYALLGTVVVNVGTLYRFRLPYVLLQIIFAVEGYRLVLAAAVKSRSMNVPATPVAADRAPNRQSSAPLL